MTTKMAGSGPKLKALPSSTVRLIASSQVITSTHSVVKELIENALDAAATCIDINLGNYGFGKIEVRDNGCGIERSDTPYMARPHYTSKITSSEDLGTLLTYGFRGEALGSLCCVSDVSITTRTADDDVSTVYELDRHGVIVNSKPSHLGVGTTVVAANLFKYVPVRKQFYSTARKQRDELKRVEDLVVTYGVIYPCVRFELRHNKSVIWQKGAVADYRSALLGVWGAGTMGHMVHLKKRQEEFDVECFLPKHSSAGQLTLKGNDRCFLFVNKRPVVMKDVDKLLHRYYSNTTGCNRAPMAFISVTVDASSVDVNVDPNKTKVMLHEKSSFLKFVADLFTEIYGPVESTGDKNCDTECLSVCTSPCESTATSASRRTDNVEYANEACHVIGQEPINRDINPEPRRVFGCVSSSRNEEINNNTFAFDGATSTPIHREDVRPRLPQMYSDLNMTDVKHSPPESNLSDTNHLHLEAHSDYRRDESSKNDAASISNIIHSSAAKSLNSTCSIDFNLLDDDFDFPVMEKLAAEHDIVSPSGGVEMLREDGHFQKNDSCVPDFLSDVPRSDVGCEDVAKEWSRGETVVDKDGKAAQPVTLLLPSHTNDDRQNLDKTGFASCGDLSIATRQTTLDDLVEGHSIKRPTSSYIFFCKEMRSKVVAESPGANIQEVSRVVGERWRSLGTEERKQYDAMAAADALRYRNPISSQKEPNMTQNQADIHRKKRKIGQTSGQRALPAMFSQHSPIARHVKQELVNFSMKALRQEYSKPFRESQLWSQQTHKMLLIGQLKSHGIWLGVHDNKIMLFHPTRAKEELICDRLMQNHVLPVNQLEQPITLCAEAVGGAECWTVLQSLGKSALGVNDLYVYYTDARLVNNGLKLRESYTDGNTSCPKIEVISMTTCMKYFGVSDLREILRLITQNSSVTVSGSRPSKVRHYIQGEAVRMSRQLPDGLSREDIEDLLRETTHQLPSGTTTCFHRRPFLWCLFDLEHMVQTQDLEHMVQRQDLEHMVQSQDFEHMVQSQDLEHMVQS